MEPCAQLDAAQNRTGSAAQTTCTVLPLLLTGDKQFSGFFLILRTNKFLDSWLRDFSVSKQNVSSTKNVQVKMVSLFFDKRREQGSIIFLA